VRHGGLQKARRCPIVGAVSTVVPASVAALSGRVGRCVVALLLLQAPAAALRFTDVTTAAGLLYRHGYVAPLVAADGSFDERRHFAGGVAAGDYDNDGWIDLYVVRGDIGPDLLFRNRGDGRFEEVGAAAGVALNGRAGAGPTFADVDGDGWLDLIVGGVPGVPVVLFRNRGDGTFDDVTALSGIRSARGTYSAAFGDYDRDGDLDLLLTHWDSFLAAGESSETLWRNEGGWRFSDVSLSAGITATILRGEPAVFDYTFTPNFADLDGDAWPDIVLTADFGTSTVLRNARDGTFTDITDRQVVTDENGMGAAIGDFDNDGVLDWFVSSVWDPNGVTDEHWGTTGNRLYHGRGDGTFTDVTDVAGVREGYWGWAATWTDVNNDGYLDLFHANGFGRSADYVPTRDFYADPARLFVSNGDGTFTERAAELGLEDHGMGRGVVSFDYDRDGDLDLFIANNSDAPRLFRNDGGNANHWLTVTLGGALANAQGIGARVSLTAGAVTQTRELHAGSNFASQDPAEAHFGLGAAGSAACLRVTWPDGSTTVRTEVAADQRLRIAFTEMRTPAATLSPPATPTPTPGAPCVGDCNADLKVTVDEILQGVNIALGEAAIDACPRFDRNGDRLVTVDEVLAGIDAALMGCGYFR